MEGEAGKGVGDPEGSPLVDQLEQLPVAIIGLTHAVRELTDTARELTDAARELTEKLERQTQPVSLEKREWKIENMPVNQVLKKIIQEVFGQDRDLQEISKEEWRSKINVNEIVARVKGRFGEHLSNLPRKVTINDVIEFCKLPEKFFASGGVGPLRPFIYPGLLIYEGGGDFRIPSLEEWRQLNGPLEIPIGMIFPDLYSKFPKGEVTSTYKALTRVCFTPFGLAQIPREELLKVPQIGKKRLPIALMIKDKAENYVEKLAEKMEEIKGFEVQEIPSHMLPSTSIVD